MILSPFEPGGAKWDLFGEIREEYDIDQLALALIPDHEGQDRSWRGYARTLFSAVTSQARAGGVTDVKKLFELLVVAKKSELEMLVAGTPAQPFFEEHNDRMLDSIRSVLSSAVGALQHVARQESSPLSVKQWVRSGQRRALHSLSGRSDRGAALDSLGLDAPRHFRSHERACKRVRGRTDAGSEALVRRR